MSATNLGRHRVWPLMATATATIFAWTWDISWSATVAAPDGWSWPHAITVLGCGAWSVGLIVVSGKRSRLVAVSSLVVLLLLGSMVGTVASGDEAIDGHGYLGVANGLLSAGLGLLALGTLFAVTERRGAEDAAWSLSAVLAGGIVLFWLAAMTVDYTGWPNLWRGTQFSLVCGSAYGLTFAYASRVADTSWAATRIAGAYMALAAFFGVLLFLLPLSWFLPEASPGHFTLLAGPLVLIAPAAAADVLGSLPWPGPPSVADTLCAAVLGTCLVATVSLTHWYVAGWLVEPGGPGRGIADLWWPAPAPHGDWQHRYWTLAAGRRVWAAGLVGAVGASSLSAWLGLRLGGLFQKDYLDARGH